MTLVENTSPHKHAVVLSGGGADGAYEVGVLKALLNSKTPGAGGGPLVPQIFTGTSIGSFNATFMVSQWDEFGASAVGNLERLWLDRMAWQGPTNGGFRVRGLPLELLDPEAYFPNPLRPFSHLMDDVLFIGSDIFRRLEHVFLGREPVLERLLEFVNLSSFVSVSPWEETLRETIDYKNVRDASVDLAIAATNWVEGDVTLFRNRDMTDRMGPEAIRASSAVPGFYPHATVGARTFVDGAVLMNTPLKPAIKCDADVLHVIYMNTEISKMPLDPIQSTLDTLYRSQIIAWASAVNRDIEKAALYNEAIDLLDRIMKKEDLSEAKMKRFINTAGPMLKRLRQTVEYRPLTIHRYFPPDGLDGALGFLNLERPRIARLIDQGFEDAVAHDCEVNACICHPKHA